MPGEFAGTTPDTANPNRQFVCGPRYIDDIVLRDRDTTGSGTLDERLYSMQDANWNVVAVATPAAVIQERNAYSPYGVPVFLTGTFTARSSSNFAWERLYCGYQFEAATGLYQVRHRVYHPGLGTWVQRDPMKYTDGINLFAYTRNNPISNADALGLGPCGLPGNFNPDSVDDLKKYIRSLPRGPQLVAALKKMYQCLNRENPQWGRNWVEAEKYTKVRNERKRREGRGRGGRGGRITDELLAAQAVAGLVIVAGYEFYLDECEKAAMEGVKKIGLCKFLQLMDEFGALPEGINFEFMLRGEFYQARLVENTTGCYWVVSHDEEFYRWYGLNWDGELFGWVWEEVADIRIGKCPAHSRMRGGCRRWNVNAGL